MKQQRLLTAGRGAGEPPFVPGGPAVAAFVRGRRGGPATWSPADFERYLDAQAADVVAGKVPRHLGRCVLPISGRTLAAAGYADQQAAHDSHDCMRLWVAEQQRSNVTSAT